jgi:phage tail-like protein
MDANQTRFHLLLGQQDWASCAAEAVSWDGTRNELTLQQVVFQFQPPPSDHFPSLGDRRGAARDRYGNFYWIDAAKTGILVNGAPGDSRGLPLSGLTITTHHYLAAGVADPPGLLVYDIHTNEPPRQILWPKSAPFAPFDMAANPDGGLWILDRDNRALWRLDRLFNILSTAPPPPAERDPFQPEDGSSVRTTSQPPGLAPVALPMTDPAAIAALADNSVLVLAGDAVYRYDGRWSAPVRLGVRGYDMAYADPLVYIAAPDGDQSYAFQLTVNGGQIGLNMQPSYYPMRLFGGRGIIASGKQVYYDSRDQWVPLVEMRRPQYAEMSTVVTRVFDGKEPDCVWHRLLIDGVIPPRASVGVYSRAANSTSELANAIWQPEPPLYQRGDGSEQPWVQQLRGNRAGTWELLFQRAAGRYMQIRLDLKGDGRSTPRLRALRAYYPRFSYSKSYLPAVYREDNDSASFVERFLANMEGFYTAIEDRIAMVQVLFEIANAPAETLDWLATWFGVALDSAWDEPTRRLFLRHVMDFFQYRGTTRGITMALRLATESCAGEAIFDPNAKPRPGGIRLVEAFRRRSTAPGTATAADQPLWTNYLTRRYRRIEDLNSAWLTTYASFDQIPLPATTPWLAVRRADWQEFLTVVLPTRDSAHRFTVFLPVPQGGTANTATQQTSAELVKRIVDLEKPAHAVYDIQFYWAFFRVGEARLGQDTVLDTGSRSPKLLPPVVLGTSYVASGYLAPGYPQNLKDRQVLNSERSILHE